MRRSVWFMLVLGGFSLLQNPLSAQDVGDLSLAPGFEGGVVVPTLSLAEPGAMDLDPLSGDLFIDNTAGENANGSVGQILRVNPHTGEASVLIGVSNGFCLGFTPDGTMYFGVSNFLLAKWDRQRNLFRKFAIIPGVRGFDVGANGKLYIGEGSYGPRGLYPDSILEVDARTGIFRPVFTSAAASEDTGTLYDALSSVAILDGELYATYKGGQMVKKAGESHTVTNTLHALVGGLNQAPLYTQDKILYQYDIAGGQLFAVVNGQTRLLAYGDAIRGTNIDFAGVTTDGSTLYLCGDYNRVIALKATNGNIRSTLTADINQATLAGKVLDSVTGEPVPGATIALTGGLEATTAEDGSYAITAPASTYEITIVKPGYLKSYTNIDLGLGDQTKDLPATTGLPTWLAPGLKAEIWANPEQGIVGSSDVRADAEGNIYSMNINAARITKHFRDPETGAHSSAYEFAYGDGLAGSWTVAIDGENNVWATNGNSGVLKLPQRAVGEAHILTADPGDNSIVRNQDGTMVNVDLTRDVDGLGFLSDGSVVMSSGNGGDPSPPCNPEGTIDSLLKWKQGSCPLILTRGVPCEGGEDVFFNPDILRVDNQDRIWVANKGGNVVRVDADTGCVDWYLPGDGAGIEEHRLGSYTAVAPDPAGNIFLRGIRFAPEENVIRIYEDGKFYMAVGGTRQCFGGITFPNANGSEVIYCDGDTLVRVYTESGEPIADVVRNGVTPE